MPMRIHPLNNRMRCVSALVLALFFWGIPGSPAQQLPPRPYGIPRPLLPDAVIDTLINEVSGEIPLNNERLLAPFEHKRSAEEYEKVFRESQIVYQKLKEYGIQDCGIEEVPRALLSPVTWNAQSAELWMLEPERTKLIDLDNVPACLAEQSQPSDVTAELVYVGSGNRDECYKSKDVKGKIVLATGRAYSVHEMAVKKRGAVGIVITWATNSDFDPDEVGRDTLARQFDPSAPGTITPTFGFMISARQGARLAALLADGRRVVLHAKCQTNYYPFRNEIVWALIKGCELPEEELVFTAHLFEEKAYQGANDNMSGSVSILETARVLQKLVTEKRIPPLRRSVRFLWTDEEAGTLGYLMKYPGLQKRIFANINQDMVGENLRLHASSLHLVQTPFSMPTYLNDVLANFFEFVGETNRDNIVNRPVKFVKPILSPAGSRDPFSYDIDGFSGGSDHTIFLDGGIGIPAVQLGVWPDMWYHTNLDRPDKSDSTQLKRAAFIGTAAAIFMAGASSAEALRLAGEVLSRGQARIGSEEGRAYALLSGGQRLALGQDYKEARNILHQAFLREAITLDSTMFFAKEDKALAGHVEKLSRSLAKNEESAVEDLAAQYTLAASLAGVEAIEPGTTPEERRLDALVPVRTKDMTGFFNGRDFLERLKGTTVPEYRLGRGEDFEIRNFIDGRRSVLEIRNAVSAEFRPIPLVDVENYIKVLEIGGMLRLEKKNPPNIAGREPDA